MKLQPLSHMSEYEIIDSLGDHLKRGADIARRLGQTQGKQKWLQVAQLLDRVYHKTQMLATMRSLNRTDTLTLLDIERRKMLEQTETKTVN